MNWTLYFVGFVYDGRVANMFHGPFLHLEDAQTALNSMYEPERYSIVEQVIQLGLVED